MWNEARLTRRPLEFQCETSLLLGCDGKVRIPFQTSRGINPHVLIWRGEGAQVKLCQKTRCSSRVRRVCQGTFFELHQVCQVPFRISRGNMGFLPRRCSGKGPQLSMTVEPRGFSQVGAGFSSYIRELREPLVVPQGSPISSRVVRGSWGLLSSHCRTNRPHLGLCPKTPCSSPMATGISGLHSRFTHGLTPRLKLKQRTPLSSRVATSISWCPLSGLKGVKPPLEF